MYFDFDFDFDWLNMIILIFLEKQNLLFVLVNLNLY